MVNNSEYKEQGYAVFRSGIRVSEQVYNTEKDAQNEKNHWESIIKRWPDGTQITVKEVKH